jgi:hypothetical protein
MELRKQISDLNDKITNMINLYDQHNNKLTHVSKEDEHI